MSPKRLLLFDIDGTILTTVRRAFERPFSESIREVLGVEVDTVSYRAGGKTDPQMIHELLAGSGFSHEAVESAIPAIRERYLDKFRHHVRTREDAPLEPGVPALLEILSKRGDAVLGLLTGNFEAGARIKLGVHGLDRYFKFGAFGDGAADRSLLPERAVEAARSSTGIHFRGKDIVIIGDTPHDITCGRTLGVRTIAVATGLYSSEILRLENPDYLFEDLTDRERVLGALLLDWTRG